MACLFIVILRQTLSGRVPLSRAAASRYKRPNLFMEWAMKILVIGFGLGLACASGVNAQAVSGADAAAVLYAPKVAEVEMMAKKVLPKDQAKVLQMVARDQLYYAAIAISPDEGLMSEATVAAANFHTIDAASTAALAECNAKRTGAAECVIVALVRPEGWQPGGLQLSSDATADFQTAYDGGALAISATTGAWGIAGTAEDAVTACVARNPDATDCQVVIAN
jgi:hypothetical protein